jgi:preprotein translocase SecE subunit
MPRTVPGLAYFQGAYHELRKVTWPTFPQVLRYLAAVMLSLVLATAAIGGLDYLLVHYFLRFFVKSS